MSAVSQGLSPLESYRELTDFARKCGENALRLAMHAAVPQSFRADLLHLLKLNFLPEAVRDPAVEADVLLAPFTEDLSGGYYQFDTEARRQLLDRLDAAHPQRNGSRLEQVARFLAGYVAREEEKLEASADPLRRDFLEIQRWVALAHLDPDSAARQLAYALEHVEESGRAAVRLQVGGLIRSLSAPLAAHPELLIYAAGLRSLEEGRFQEGRQMLERLGQGEVQVAGLKLRPVDAVLSAWKSRLEPAAREAGPRVEHATILIVTEAGASSWTDEPLYQRWVHAGFHPECLSMHGVAFTTEAEALRFVSGHDAGFLILDERFLDLEQERVSAIFGLPSLPVIPLWRPRLASPGARERYLSHRLHLGWLAEPIEMAVGPDIPALEEKVQAAVAAIGRWANAPENGLDVARQQLAFFQQYNPGSDNELRARVGLEVQNARSAAHELLTRSDLARARGLLENALDVQTETAGAEAPVTFEVLAELAQVLAAQGEFEPAVALLQRVLAGAHQFGAMNLEITALARLGEVQASLGHKDQALEFLSKAVALSEQISDPRSAEIRALLEGLKPEPPDTAPPGSDVAADKGAERTRPKPQPGDSRQTGYDVFLAYAAQDENVASAMARYLEQRGIRCWIARAPIHPSEDWAHAIGKAIAGCRLLVVIMSRASPGDRSVLRELNLAAKAEKTVIAFRIDPVGPSTEFSNYGASLQLLDATHDWESQLPKLVEAIQSSLGRAPSAQKPTRSVQRKMAKQRGNIFLSYASADRARVEPLANALLQLGWPVWWDRTIPAGQSFAQVIEKQLDEARCVVVVWTRNSVDSDWVKTEAEEGLRRGILIPVLLEEVQIPLGFERIQTVRLVGWSGETTNSEFERLVQGISAVVPALVDSAPRNKTEKPSIGERIRGWFTGDSGKETAASHAGAKRQIRCKVFLNYRRDDAAGYALALRSALTQNVGPGGQILMNADGVGLGEDFAPAIENAVGACRVMVVLIGRQWLAVSDAGGRRRLDDPGDWVQNEIRTALERGLSVIPVLVGGAYMPAASYLPRPIAGLARRQAVELSDADWDSGIDVLTRAIASVSTSAGGAPADALE